MNCDRGLGEQVFLYKMSRPKLKRSLLILGIRNQGPRGNFNNRQIQNSANFFPPRYSKLTVLLILGIDIHLLSVGLGLTMLLSNLIIPRALNKA
jgi:hypothetical protein